MLRQKFQAPSKSELQTLNLSVFRLPSSAAGAVLLVPAPAADEVGTTVYFLERGQRKP